MPGQFVNLLLDVVGLILRRPFSIARLRDGEMELLYKVVGPGTKRMAELVAGEKIDSIGPLGKGFSMPATGSKPLLVGGGIGLPPLIFLRDVLLRYGVQPRVLAGWKTAAERYYEDDHCETHYATDDGSLGHHGLVTDLLEAYLQNGDSVTIYACGPEPMLKVVASLASTYNAPCQMALEGVFACGTGLCLGCAVSTSDAYRKKHGRKYRLVCVDGPVFPSGDIAL